MTKYKIAFGTSGWRERMDSGFNGDNVLRAAAGIGRYLSSLHKSGRVIVGYDTRKNSAEFADLVCGAMDSFGFDVLITDGPTPTPAVIYTILEKKAIGGIQVTASHNPPEYNGIKFMVESGAAPLKDVTNKVEALVSDDVPITYPCKGSRISAKPSYLAALTKKFGLSKAKGMRIVVDTRHGAGGGYLSDALEANGAEVYSINKGYDSNFGGLSPNPSEPNVSGLISEVKEKGAAIGIANDGDADRFAIVDSSGKYYGANECGLMLCEYLFGVKGVRGKVAKSIQSTAAIDRLCSKFNVPFVEVPVGFKYIAKELFDGAVFGVEGAAQGVAFGGWIPDKDGIAAGALMCEMVAAEGIPLDKIWARVSKEYGYGQFVTFEIPKSSAALAALDSLKKDTTAELFGGRKIVARSSLDGIRLNLDGDAWVLVRESGTEPSVRVYVETRTKAEADKLISATKQFFGL